MNMDTLHSFTHLTDDELVLEVKQCARSEREATVRLIACLAELDARRLYLAQGCSSLFTYCTQVLHLSEHAAYGRIEAARAARRFPIILELLVEGAITLTTVTLLAPYLTEENVGAVLEAARHKSKREVEVQVAALRPLPPIPASIRKVPERRTSLPVVANPLVDDPGTGTVVLPPSSAVVKPLAPEQYKIQFTISRETHDKLRRAQDLLRHSIPDGDPAKIFDKALTLLLADVEKKKLAAALKPSLGRPRTTTSRHIPAGVKREVWKRDEGRCAFVAAQGRCAERGFLEFHHVIPYADGGATTVSNLQLRCRAHNVYESEQWFGALIAREVTEMRYGDTP